MHNTKDPEYIEVDDDVLRGNLTNPPQLTPTGKISHAKTRVYTQRYRKAWEQMPDFKGWLTSVPHQPTRAFCTYCRKNLHAHRLSLLKHTCTMKHQRGALMHQKESSAEAAAAAVVDEKKIPQIKVQLRDETDGIEEEEDEHFKLEDTEDNDDDDEDDDDIEYVVERLDDEELDDDQSKDVEDDDYPKDVEDDEYPDDEDEENLPTTKKLKTDQPDNTTRPDTLAEAMAHVHDEYIDDNGESVNVELEMVVESVDPNAQEMRIVSVRSERSDAQLAVENYDHDENSADYTQDHEKEDNQPLADHPGTASSCKSSALGESSDAASETDETDRILHRTPLSMPVRRDYLTRPSTARSISSGSNGLPVSTTAKTITLTSGGKTVTLDSAAVTTYAGGSRFLLNSKGQTAAIVAGDKGSPGLRSGTQVKIAQHQQNPNTGTNSVPGTSQPAPRKHIILKSVKPLVAKKPHLSTHVLDTSKGLPVGGLQISLYKLMDGRWTFLSESNTTADGRCADLVDTSKSTFTAGRYKLHFDVDKYFTLRRIETIYPFIEIIFDVKNPTEHYHIPLLISPFGYTTYRGS